MANEPEGWNIPVDSRSKESELLELLKGYEIIRHTNKEEDYNYMYPEDVTLEVVNPSKIEHLYIEISDDFTVFYSPWHTHYPSYEYYYKMMKNDIKKILNNEFGGYGVYKNDKWILSDIVEKSKEELNPKEIFSSIIKKLDNDYKYIGQDIDDSIKEDIDIIKDDIMETKKDLLKNKTVIKILYWDEKLEYQYIDGEFIKVK